MSFFGHFWPFLAQFGPLGSLLLAHMTADSGSTHTHNTEKCPRHIDRQKKTLISSLLRSKTKYGSKWTRKWPKNGPKWPPIKKPNCPSEPARYAISKNGLTFYPRPKNDWNVPKCPFWSISGHFWPNLALLGSYYGPIWLQTRVLHTHTM